ncbi:MAG: hypothetical protein ACFFEY_18105 [Candidatus Thorarchaeota archaeon]
MSQILLIDNYPRGFNTDRIVRIQEIVNGLNAEINLKIFHYSQLKYEVLEKSNGVIISGSSHNVSSFYYNQKLKKKFLPQINFILNSYGVPILAICFGHHLVSYAYGAQISRMRIPDSGGKIIFLKFSRTDDLIKKKDIPVDTHHLDFVSPNDCEIQKNFEIISTSNIVGYKIIQYMKHFEKPIFSLQFHPETHNPQFYCLNLSNERVITKTMSIGREIIKNFICFCLNNLDLL